jgi:hypothetical protein
MHVLLLDVRSFPYIAVIQHNNQIAAERNSCHHYIVERLNWAPQRLSAVSSIIVFPHPLYSFPDTNPAKQPIIAMSPIM